jgi:predicted transcriptional regulator
MAKCFETRQAMHITARRVRVTIVAVEKQKVGLFHILNVCKLELRSF